MNLVEGAEGRFDAVLAEVKSGESDSPNRIWRNGETSHIEYLLRFVGWHNDDEKIRIAAKQLSRRYTFEESNLRIRYIIFAERINLAWSSRGVKYITFDDCIKYISEERGRCWARSGIGRRSMHDQWNPLIKHLFQIANDNSLISSRRREEIRRILHKGLALRPVRKQPSRG
jgi:hypothetical protein